MKMTRAEKHRLGTGLLFIGPWVVGFLALTVYPLLSTLAYSLCDYSVLMPASFVGFTNYRDLFTDELFWKSLSNTLFFAAFSIPLGLIVSLSLAILLNFNVRGRGVFRTIFFLPSLMPAISLAVLWQWMLNGELGLFNDALRPVLGVVNTLTGAHFTAPNWFADARFAKWGLIFTGLWGVGHAVVIYLAGLQEVPRHFYEAAEIDGASFWQKTWHITLPVISPVIYFNLIMSLIGTLQVFTVPYIITNGLDGPERSLMFITTYLYHNAFEYSKMGYACAIGLVMFTLILGLTWVATRLSERFVHYAAK